MLHRPDGFTIYVGAVIMDIGNDYGYREVKLLVGKIIKRRSSRPSYLPGIICNYCGSMTQYRRYFISFWISPISQDTCIFSIQKYAKNKVLLKR